MACQFTFGCSGFDLLSCSNSDSSFNIVSHISPAISSPTFFENRFGFPESLLHQRATVLGLNCDQSIHGFGKLLHMSNRSPMGISVQQTRGFKTKRSVETIALGQKKPSSAEELLGM